MTRTLIGIGFICVVAGAAVLVGVRPTVARGHALAAMIFEAQDGVTIECDDNVPIGAAGARFKCRAAATDGSTAVFDMTIARDGTIKRTLVESTAPTLRSKSGDPWGK